MRISTTSIHPKTMLTRLCRDAEDVQTRSRDASLDSGLLDPQALGKVIHHLAQSLSQLHLWLPPQHLLGLRHRDSPVIQHNT